MKKEAVVSSRNLVKTFDQLRAVAHPLRLRMLELFAEGPRTTKQVAELLGEPPTKLYHHANALERAGLLKLSKTRQNRGAVEKWYEAAPGTISGRQPTRSRPMRQAISGLATMVLEQTRHELELALRKSPAGRPLVMRIPAVGNEKEIDHIRKRLLQVVNELRDEKSKEKPVDEGELQRWTLTIAFAPAARARG